VGKASVDDCATTGLVAKIARANSTK